MAAVTPDSQPPRAATRTGHAGRESISFWFAFAAIVLAGVFLRTWQIGDQFVIDDEMHAIRAMMRYSPQYILTHFFDSDICIPQALFLKFLSGISPLTETTVRALSLAFGIALLFWPLLLWKRVESKISLLILAALTALHPMLILYSRYERQYIVVIVLVTGCLLSFYQFCVTGKLRFMVLHALTAGIAMYFHLLAAPTVCAPLALMIASNLLGGFPLGRKFRGRDIALAAAVLCATVAVTLGPPIVVDHQALTSKSMKSGLTAPMFYYTALMFLGVKNAWIGVPVLVVLCLGVVRLFRQNRPLASIIAIPFALQVAAMVILRPSMLNVPDVFVRYIFWELPLMLFCFVAGLGAMRELARRALPMTAGLELMIAGAWIALCPTWDLMYRHNNFIFPYMYQRQLTAKPRYIPKIYTTLMKYPGQGAIAEAPWVYFKDVTAWPDYQAVHRRNEYALLMTDLYWSPPQLNQNEDGVRGERLRFKKFITLDDAGRNPEIEFLIFHLNPIEECGRPVNLPAMNMNAIHSKIDPLIWTRIHSDSYTETYIKRH